MIKGKQLLFDELYKWLQNNQNKKWRLYAIGGSFGSLNILRFNDNWTVAFDHSDGGNKFINFAAFDDENHWIQEIHFSDFDELKYRIEVYNENPLELLIEWRDTIDGLDSSFAIFQEIK